MFFRIPTEAIKPRHRETQQAILQLAKWQHRGMLESELVTLLQSTTSGDRETKSTLQHATKFPKTNEEYDAHINKLMRAAIEEEIEEEQQLGQSDSDTDSDSDFEFGTSGDELNSGDDSDDDSEEF